jgi:hypothetical protein
VHFDVVANDVALMESKLYSLWQALQVMKRWKLASNPEEEKKISLIGIETGIIQ